MPLNYHPERLHARRTMRLSIAVDTFLRILQGMDGIKRIRCEWLPEDVRCVGILTDLMVNTVVLVLESAEFKEIPEGSISEEIRLNFTEYWGDVMPESASLGTLSSR